MRYKLSCAALLLCATGCIQRSVTIDSSPSGARVFYDHREVGETPLKLRFTHYGSHSLIVLKEGYHPWRGRLDLDEKSWAVFPLDIFTEALSPGVYRDRRNITIGLRKAKGGEPPAVVERE